MERIIFTPYQLQDSRWVARFCYRCYSSDKIYETSVSFHKRYFFTKSDAETFLEEEDKRLKNC